MTTTTTIGARGQMVVPKKIRDALGLGDGSLVILEVQENRLVVRPAHAVPIEHYAPPRKAAFMLEDATNAAEYVRAREQVRAMGLDPDKVPHERPAK